MAFLFRIEKGEKIAIVGEPAVGNHAVKDDRRIGAPKRWEGKGWRGKYRRSKLPTAAGACPGNSAGKLCV